MPSYQIEFVGGGELNRPPLQIICIDDRQALDWASGLLGHHLGAEVSTSARKVGWVSTADTRSGVRVIFACR